MPQLVIMKTSYSIYMYVFDGARTVNRHRVQSTESARGFLQEMLEVYPDIKISNWDTDTLTMPAVIGPAMR